MKKQNKSVVATAGNVPRSLRSGRPIPAVPHFKRSAKIDEYTATTSHPYERLFARRSSAVLEEPFWSSYLSICSLCWKRIFSCAGRVSSAHTAFSAVCLCSALGKESGSLLVLFYCFGYVGFWSASRQYTYSPIEDSWNSWPELIHNMTSRTRRGWQRRISSLVRFAL